MSAITRVEKRSLPDHDGTPIAVFNDDLLVIGTLTFEKNTSRWTDAPGQLPHRPMRNKAKYR